MNYILEEQREKKIAVIENESRSKGVIWSMRIFCLYDTQFRDEFASAFEHLGKTSQICIELCN